MAVKNHDKSFYIQTQYFCSKFNIAILNFEQKIMCLDVKWFLFIILGWFHTWNQKLNFCVVFLLMPFEKLQILKSLLLDIFISLIIFMIKNWFQTKQYSCQFLNKLIVKKIQKVVIIQLNEKIYTFHKVNPICIFWTKYIFCVRNRFLIITYE